MQAHSSQLFHFFVSVFFVVFGFLVGDGGGGGGAGTLLLQNTPDITRHVST